MLGGRGNWRWAGTALVLGIVIFHVSRASRPHTELILILAALLAGAIGGPLAYFAGNRLGAVDMPDTMMALVALALGWSIIMPLLMSLSRHLDGFGHLETR